MRRCTAQQTGAHEDVPKNGGKQNEEERGRTGADVGPTNEAALAEHPVVSVHQQVTHSPDKDPVTQNFTSRGLLSAIRAFSP
eukprot:CAMPEP_0194523316 /NCGR_PEP_ID=MMETSP0253-20130528/58179_1 /TAXON_ID=2966 /ORGANISM="Noctiluca scintillans" /LENGTH=81 /DNA_ID=CAMNT_0039367841 /DNA_START=841 /DNA_END=1083 /DNA_ORIENTATION=+